MKKSDSTTGDVEGPLGNTESSPSNTADEPATTLGRTAVETAALPSVEELQVKLDAATARLAQFDAVKRELAEARAELARLGVAKIAADEEEKLVAAKIAKGLTELQARAVVRRQIAFDQSDMGRMYRAKREAHLTDRV